MIARNADAALRHDPSAALRSNAGARRQRESRPDMNAAMLHSQGDKIRELRHALVDAGFVALDQQAAALGLPRSTTWFVLQGMHKCAGLRAGLIARMWHAPGLPATVRRVLTDYVTERSRGAYGHGDAKRRRFVAHLARSGFPISGSASELEHDPEKACPGLDPGWEPVFGKDHAQTKI
jgi:hypothetical protein